MVKEKLVLAYSGGLDTSYCAVYLSQDKGYEVHSVLVDTGGFSDEELKSVEEKAYKMGVTAHRTIKATNKFYKECIRFLVYGNILKNNTYPLSVSAERIFQAMAIAEYAKEIDADYIAHGSTGAGNDQVRFDLAFEIIHPKAQIITPIRDMQLSREEEIEYLKKNGVDMDWSKAAYSVNKGIWGTSVGGKETLTSDQYLPEEAFPTQVSEKDPVEITLDFEYGELIGVNGNLVANPVDAIKELELIAAPYGIGRDVHVGDTIIGIKGRVGFEAPAPLIIIKAHHLLEKHVLTKWQQYWKEQMSSWYGMLLHEGQFMEPVMRNIEKFMEDTQKTVNGQVFVRLEPYRFTVLGVKSEQDLMSSKFGHYGEMNKGWNGEDVKGFTRILANQMKIHQAVNEDAES